MEFLSDALEDLESVHGEDAIIAMQGVVYAARQLVGSSKPKRSRLKRLISEDDHVDAGYVILQ